MKNISHLSLPEIRKKLENNEIPFSGITPLGSSEFHFLEPSFYAGVAMHSGHLVRPEVGNSMLATEKERLREEDPCTEKFIDKLPIQIIGRDSRFEYDLNREAGRSIYDNKEKNWGLKVWKTKPDSRQRNLSLLKHKEFYDLMDIVVEYVNRQNKYSVVFDIHSYCYRREEDIPWQDDPNPEINIGTGAVNRKIFGKIIEDFKNNLSDVKIGNYPVRIAENEIFSGGYLAKRLSKMFPEKLLVIALEFKKIFMDEATGELYDYEFEILIRGFNKSVQKIVRSDFFR